LYCIEQISNEKVSLECNHEFCKDCLKEYLEYTIKSENKNSIDCPNCRQSIKETGNVEIDEIVNNLCKKEIIDSSYDIMIRINSIMFEIDGINRLDYIENITNVIDDYIENRTNVIDNYIINLTNRGSTINLVRVVKSDKKKYIRKDNNKYYKSIKLPKLKFNKKDNFKMKNKKNYKCLR
jgi:hypothetical protein